jgi:phosphoribosylaminoimidazole-succinocarboxamide synthase
VQKPNRFSFLRQGKVRDVNAFDDDHLLVVASDRISAFNHMLPNPIPGKESILFTPDSSRFRPADSYRPGGSPPSFDKQCVRDHLERVQWNKNHRFPNYLRMS